MIFGSFFIFSGTLRGKSRTSIAKAIRNLSPRRLSGSMAPKRCFDKRKEAPLAMVSVAMSRHAARMDS